MEYPNTVISIRDGMSYLLPSYKEGIVNEVSPFGCNLIKNPFTVLYMEVSQLFKKLY